MAYAPTFWLLPLLFLTAACQPVAWAPSDSGLGREVVTSTPGWLKKPPPVAISPALQVAIAVATLPAVTCVVAPNRITTFTDAGGPGTPRSPCRPCGPSGPRGPCGPCGPCGPGGSCPALKSLASSEPSMTFAVVTAPFLIFLPETAPFFSWAVPTELPGSTPAA